MDITGCVLYVSVLLDTNMDATKMSSEPLASTSSTALFSSQQSPKKLYQQKSASSAQPEYQWDDFSLGSFLDNSKDGMLMTNNSGSNGVATVTATTPAATGGSQKSSTVTFTGGAQLLGMQGENSRDSLGSGVGKFDVSVLIAKVNLIECF